MSVNPGYGGQKFIENSLEKIKKCKEMIDKSGCNVEIEAMVESELKILKVLAMLGQIFSLLDQLYLKPKVIKKPFLK